MKRYLCWSGASARCGRLQPARRETGPLQGNPAPDFTLKDLADNGQAFRFPGESGAVELLGDLVPSLSGGDPFHDASQ